MRSYFGTALILGVAMATASIAGCGSSEKGKDSAHGEGITGTVGLALQVVPGITINTISYSITGNGISLSGSLDVSNSTAGSQLVIGGIPAGKGYTIGLTAASTDGQTTCSGAATFDVSPLSTTSVSPHLQCRAGKTGGVGVNPTINVCPSVNTITATPDHADVGSPIAVAGGASDIDGGPSPLTYTWTATSGTFASASSANTTFTCAATGSSTLTFTVSDGECSDTGSITVTCTAPVVTTNSILSGKSAACLSCAQLNGCLDPSCETITGNAAAGPAAGTARSTLCLDTLACVVTSKCANSGTGTPCYCGSVSGAACLGAGAANGVCKSQEERGLESSDPSAIATGFGDTAKGGGLANTLVQCLNDSECTACFQ
jgi:hypothetical protein